MSTKAELARILGNLPLEGFQGAYLRGSLLIVERVIPKDLGVDFLEGLSVENFIQVEKSESIAYPAEWDMVTAVAVAMQSAITEQGLLPIAITVRSKVEFRKRVDPHGSRTSPSLPSFLLCPVLEYPDAGWTDDGFVISFAPQHPYMPSEISMVLYEPQETE